MHSVDGPRRHRGDPRPHAKRALEAAEFVQRVPHPTDGRATLIQITPAGRERVDAATTELNARIFRNTGFDPREVEQLNALLTGFRRDAGDFDEQ